MSFMDYIVRIYRHEKDRPRSIVGTVEEVGTEGKRAFTNLDELWEILNRSKDAESSSALRRKKAKTPSPSGEEGKSQPPSPLGGESRGEGVT